MVKEMKKMKDSSMLQRENRKRQEARTVLVTRQVRMFSEMTEIQMITNENASGRFGSYVNAMNAMKRK